METAWGIFLVASSLLCWGGQTIAWLAPATAVRFGLMEGESDVEPAYWADIRGEARWDSLTLWTLLVAGILLIIGTDAWAYFGLVGGGMYVYFAGRGISTRLAMLRDGFRVGTPRNVKVGYTFLGLWGAAGAITIATGVVALPTS
jgi:hypothetical protein